MLDSVATNGFNSRARRLYTCATNACEQTFHTAHTLHRCATNAWEQTCRDVCDGPTQYTPAGHPGCVAECAEPIGSVDGNLNQNGNTNSPVDCVMSNFGERLSDAS